VWYAIRSQTISLLCLSIRWHLIGLGINADTLPTSSK
jgi:hypothetical protein